jgi:APA family basic amino acid/polyamine antiporter
MAILSKSKQLNKELTLFNIYTIATGATIASGFFLLPGLAFAQAGPAMVISYLIAAIPVIPALLSTAELSTAMPRAGGVYFFLDRSMGPMLGTIGGLGTWLALILKTAFALVGIGAYLSLYLPHMEMLPVAIGFAIFFGLINVFGAKRSGFFQIILVFSLLILLAIFTITGFSGIDAGHFSGLFDQDLNNIFSTAGLVYVSYVGLSKIASVSEEVKNPEKNIPRAMFLALGTAILIYICGTFIIIGLVPAAVLDGDLTPVATAAEVSMGSGGAILMTIAAVFAFFSVANAGILSCSRYPLAMSRDHLMPPVLKKLSRNKTPVNAVILTVLVVLLVLLFFDPAKIAKLAGAFQLLLFALISVAVIVMRESRLVSYDPGFKSPLYPWMQIFGILATFWLIFEMGWIPSVFTLGLVVLGVVWYFYYSRGKVARDGAIYHIFARLGERRYEGLDTELRGILKEKGLRDQDPFDAVVAAAGFIDVREERSFEEIVTLAARRMSDLFKVDMPVLKKGFLEGTQIGATPVSHGAALPHLRLPDIDHAEMVMIRTRIGVMVDIDKHFIGPQGINEPIHAFFFLVSPEENPGQHLRILAQIASHVDDETFIKQWLSMENEQDLKELLLREDRYISLTLQPGTQTAPLIGMQIQRIELPSGSLIALIHRKGELIVPGGTTILEPLDRLTIIGYPEGIQALYEQYTDHI